MANISSPISIIGAGWAGLAAAVKLSQAGIPVYVFESAAQAGGRARDIPLRNISLDNGQHIITGAYKNVLDVLETTGANIEDLFERSPLSLRLISKQKKQYLLRATQLPAPLNLLTGLFGKTGFSIMHRLQIARLSLQFITNPNSIAEQRTVQDWLGKHGQDQELVKILWEPLCLAILNTPINKASARIFLKVLKDSFLYKKKNSDLMYPRKTLSKLYVEPCIKYIEQHGGKVFLNTRVTGLLTENNRIKGVSLGEKSIKSEEVVLTIPPHQLHGLLSTNPQLLNLASQFSDFNYEPITTVYLQYPKQVQLEQPMTGLLETYSQWIIDRRICNQPGLMAVVISSSGPHMKLERDQLAALVEKEIAYIFPDWPKPISRVAIREKRATFRADTAVDFIRPENQSTFHGLWFAGDYTDTGYPATLEGAVKSAVTCARHLTELYK
jgi:squalene-associated FAD-dependent desaturase